MTVSVKLTQAEISTILRAAVAAKFDFQNIAAADVAFKVERESVTATVIVPPNAQEAPASEQPTEPSPVG